MSADLTQREATLAQAITGITWEGLPAEVRERARLCLLDDLTSLVSGTTARSAQIAASVACEVLPGDQATVFAGDGRSSAPGAAFANGVAANAYDVDDCGLYTWGHPGAQAFPAALALGEKLGASGAEVLAAMVVGYEVMFRAGRIWHDLHMPDYRACGTWGSIGCAAIGANLLHLARHETRHALGIAEYHTPSLPMLQDVAEPAMVKHGIGVGALNGLLSAELAARGFTGTSSLLTLEQYDAWVGDLGERYVLLHGMSWKEFSCCLWAHAPLLAVERIRAAHHVDPARVRRVVVETYPDALQLHVVHPRTTEEAQFSIAWPVAALLFDGEVATEQVADGRLADPALHDLAARVEFVPTDELQELYVLSETGQPGGMDAARVKVELDDGRVLESGLVEHVIYEREAALWDRERMERKTRWLLRRRLDAGQLDELIGLAWAFEESGDVREWVARVPRSPDRRRYGS